MLKKLYVVSNYFEDSIGFYSTSDQTEIAKLDSFLEKTQYYSTQKSAKEIADEKHLIALEIINTGTYSNRSDRRFNYDSYKLFVESKKEEQLSKKIISNASKLANKMVTIEDLKKEVDAVNKLLTVEEFANKAAEDSVGNYKDSEVVAFISSLKISPIDSSISINSEVSSIAHIYICRN